MSKHSTRMSHKALAAVMAGASLALAACGSTAPKSSLPVSTAPSNSIGHNSGSPSSFSLAQLESLAPFDQANQLPIYNGDPNAIPQSNIVIPAGNPPVPLGLRVPVPRVLGAWTEDTRVPWVGPVWVGTGLTPLERDAIYTARTLMALGWLYSSSHAVEEQNGRVVVMPDVAQLFTSYTGNGPIPASQELAALTDTAANAPITAPTAFSGVTPTNETYPLQPSGVYGPILNNRQQALKVEGSTINVAVCEPVTSPMMYHGTVTTPVNGTYKYMTIVSMTTKDASSSRPLEVTSVLAYTIEPNGTYYIQSPGPSAPSWAKVC